MSLNPESSPDQSSNQSMSQNPLESAAAPDPYWENVRQASEAARAADDVDRAERAAKARKMLDTIRPKIN